MKKAVMLEVRVWIEGDDEPAHDFAASTTEIVKDLIAKGAAAHPELTIKVRSVKERTS